MHKYGNKRCRCFSDSGNPIGKGCRKGSACSFLHPEDPGWPDGISTCSLQHRSNTDPYSPRVYRSRRDWQSSHRSSPSRSRSRSPRYTHHRKQDSISSSVASERELGPSRTTNDSKRSTAASTAASQTVALPTPPTTGNDPTRSFSSGFPTTSTTAGPSQPRVLQSATITTSPTFSGATENSSAARRASTSTAHQSPAEMNPTPPPPPPPPHSAPPQPTQPAPMQPPHPLPEIPSGLTAGSASPAVDVNSVIKAQMNLWDSRTIAVSKYLKAFDKLKEAEEQHSDALKLKQTTGYHSFTEVEKLKYNQEYDSVLACLEEAKRECDNAKLEILKAKPWPGSGLDAIQPSNVEIEEDMVERQAEILKFVKELHGMASDMVKLLGDIAVPPPEAEFLEDVDEGGVEDQDQGEGGEGMEEEKGAGSGMDVDLSDRSDAPLASRKKKRLDKGKGKAKAEAHPLQYSAAAEEEASRQYREISDKLAVYDEEIKMLNNHLIVYEHERKEEFKELIDEQLEQVRQANKEKNRAWNERQAERAREVNTALGHVQEVANGTDVEVRQLADEIVKMMHDADRLEQEIEKEKLERAQALQRLSSVEKRVEEYLMTQQSYEETIATLRTSINAHINRPPSPPRSPMIPSTDLILATIERNVNDSLREKMVPMIHDFREEMEKVIEKKGGEIYGLMWKTVIPTMEVLKRIEAKISTMTLTSTAGQSGESEMSVDQVLVQNQS